VAILLSIGVSELTGIWVLIEGVKIKMNLEQSAEIVSVPRKTL
jgi:hypothetical protein